MTRPPETEGQTHGDFPEIRVQHHGIARVFRRRTGRGQQLSQATPKGAPLLPMARGLAQVGDEIPKLPIQRRGARPSLPPRQFLRRPRRGRHHARDGSMDKRGSTVDRVLRVAGHEIGTGLDGGLAGESPGDQALANLRPQGGSDEQAREGGGEEKPCDGAPPRAPTG